MLPVQSEPESQARALWTEAGLVVYGFAAVGTAALGLFAWHGFDPRVVAQGGTPVIVEKDGLKIVAAPVHDLTIPLTGAATAAFTAALLVAGMLLPHVRRVGRRRAVPLLAAVSLSTLALLALATS
jgi:hypothetical protein